jgi:hypothetical protein
MKSKTLTRSKWQSVLDQFSKIEADAMATVLVGGDALGAQTEAEDVRFFGISYDPKDDSVSIEVEGLDHRISGPAEIEIAFDGIDVTSIEVKGAENLKHIVSFKPAIRFPLVAEL